MRHNRCATLAATMMVLALVLSSCTSAADPTPDPGNTTGSMQVAVTSFGLGVDPDGYDVTVGARPPQHIDRFAQLSLSDLPPGEYDVLVSGLDELQACQVAGKNPLAVQVASGEDAKVSIIVACNPGPHCNDFGDCLRAPLARSGPPLRDRK